MHGLQIRIGPSPTPSEQLERLWWAADLWVFSQFLEKSMGSVVKLQSPTVQDNLGIRIRGNLISVGLVLKWWLQDSECHSSFWASLDKSSALHSWSQICLSQLLAKGVKLIININKALQDVWSCSRVFTSPTPGSIEATGGPWKDL